MMGMTSLRRTMIPSTNAGAVGTDVEPLYGMIWRTAMMSRTNVSGPTRKVIRRSSLSSAIAQDSGLRPDPDPPTLCVDAAQRVGEEGDGVAHLVRRAAVRLGDVAHLLHRGHDLLALRRLSRSHLADFVDHVA